MASIDTGYSVELDNIGKSEWSSLLRKFDDATLYQTWSYGAVRWGEKNLSHILLRQGAEVVAIAQSKIFRVPFLGIGIAYIGWGPIWKRRHENVDKMHLHNMLRALRKEYVLRRGLFLRVFPNEIDDNSDSIISVFEKEGFRKKPRPNRTILIDLSASVEDLRMDFRRQWRQNLRKAEEAKLEVIEGHTQELYRIALEIYHEMYERKKFAESIDTKEFIHIQADLPDELKMKIMVCYYERSPIAALTWTEIGQAGVALLSATKSAALKTKASYILWWKMIRHMKDYGCRFCDVGGIDPDRNPGGYQFKSGLAEKKGKEVAFIGQFDAYKNGITGLIMESGERLRTFYRRAKLGPQKIHL
jgi:lipid II:glycine glycyltransferase (peptidoglycan interpeptide bridge formation enzyme)